MTTSRHYRKLLALALALIIAACFAVAEPGAATRASANALSDTSATAAPVIAVNEVALRIDARALPAAATAVPAIAPMPSATVHDAPQADPVQTSTPTQNAQPNSAGSTPSGWGCAAAIAYLQAHAEPSYTIVCPGNAYGHQAMTCTYHAPQCPNSRIIEIATPCPAAYMNEAHNSWVLLGQGTGIDPYGSC